MRLFYPDCLMNMSGLGGETLRFLLLQNPAETMATEFGCVCAVASSLGHIDKTIGNNVRRMGLSELPD